MMQNEVEQLKIIAAHVCEQAVDGRRQLIDEHTASFRWLMASLLALNGAGLLSLKDIKLSNSTFTLIAGSAFFLGIALAMLIARLGQKANQQMLDPMSRLALYWRNVAATGEIDEETQTDLDQRVSKAIKGAKWPAAAGFASFTFFATGLVAIAIGWVSK